MRSCCNDIAMRISMTVQSLKNPCLEGPEGFQLAMHSRPMFVWRLPVWEIPEWMAQMTQPGLVTQKRKTFFSWGSGMELIASNKRSCSLVRVLICPSSSSVDDSWSSCWIRFRFSSESTEDEVSVSSSEPTVFADVALFSTIVARFSIPLLVDGLCEYLLLGNLFVLTGMLEVVSNPWRFTVGNWLCDSDLVSPTGIERVLTEKDLLADSYSDLEASILDEKEFLLLKVISTFPELSCLICSMVGAGRGIDGVTLSITHLSGRVTSSHFIFLGRDTLAFVISVINKLILRDFWNVPVIHVLINIFESDFLIEEIVFWGDLLGLDYDNIWDNTFGSCAEHDPIHPHQPNLA
ncbi:hypothetical protein HKD37_14G040818 [Glycine soja]